MVNGLALLGRIELVFYIFRMTAVFTLFARVV